jgi:hypothetical protein
MTAIESREESGVDATPNGHNAPLDVAALRAEITQTRTDLGATVEALAAKTDVKTLAQEAIADAKLRVRSSAMSTTSRVRDNLRDYPHFWAAGALAGAVVLVASILFKRRGRQ